MEPLYSLAEEQTRAEPLTEAEPPPSAPHQHSSFLPGLIPSPFPMSQESSLQAPPFLILAQAQPCPPVTGSDYIAN